MITESHELTQDNPTVFIPGPKYGHKNDTFREIVFSWLELGMISIQESPDRYVWWNAPGDVLLHDHPRIEVLPKYNIALFGNMQPENVTSKESPWIFWSRHPKMLNSLVNSTAQKPIKFRYIHSFFSGRIENELQKQNRFQSKINWLNYIEVFKLTKGVNAPYYFDAKTHLMMLANTKLALMLPGYGPKCNREIEAIGMGAIPVFTPGCDMTYYDKLIENQNYFMIRQESDIEGILKTSDDELQKMQTMNNLWFQNNCTILGSFLQTQNIITEMRKRNTFDDTTTD